MPVSDIMLELSEELVDPAEAVLDDQIEELIDTEQDIITGVGDEDDEIIDFINSDKRLFNSDPVDFTDDEVDEVIDDDEKEEE